ncbi:DUF4251 domain-containing protein [Robiginitalea sp. M39]|uniref:DUF4251 domain-containing protein n=2 Tax=Robiginitalea aurantiaca TaxID=3056915 RepID=A0ABT7WFK4_9FLAO|nr:DUF4251 domain-containing protein [Robiginitalea aurantiaca]MDM9631700.1 DUF4251 domain-containing protein [Robiginitalea aurantiaca]
MNNTGKIIYSLFLSVNLLLLMGCGASKEPITEATWEQMENMVEGQNFTFVAKTIETMRTGSANRIDNPGYLKFEGDQVDMDLRYFGSSQMSRSYGTAEGLRVVGTAKDLSSSRNTATESVDLKFSVVNKSETLQCNLRIYSGKRAVLDVNSNLRSSIRYDGIIQ